MFVNYFLSAFRNATRYPIYFVINIIGLTVGITSCVLIGIYITHELSYEDFHQNKDRIFRVTYHPTFDGNESAQPSAPLFVGPYLKRTYPEIKDAARFMPSFGPRTIRYNDKMFDEAGFAWADSTFFKILSFQETNGRLSSALSRPNTVVITQEIATKYFGDDDPIGKTIVYNNSRAFEVTAVIENVPSNSFLQFDFLSSINNIPNLDESIIWDSPHYTTLLLLHPNASALSLQTKIDEWIKTANAPALRLEPLENVHFNTTVSNFAGRSKVTDIKYLFIFGCIGGFILIIACINYINLATARSSTRAKEVGMRKTVGATMRQLAVQFLSESAIVVLVAMLLSVPLVMLLIPIESSLIGQQLHFNVLSSATLTIAFIGGWAFLSILSGVYPAFVMAKFNPIHAMKKLIPTSSGAKLRKSLVTSQFIISLSLIIGTLIITSQLQFMREKKLGITKEDVILINGNKDINLKLNAFKQALKATVGVLEVARIDRSPFEVVYGYGFNQSANPNESGWTIVSAFGSDENLIKTMNLKLLSGRNFDPVMIADTVNEFMVNEAYLRKFSLTKEEAVGSKATLGLVASSGPGTIVGVVNDFHYQSLHNKIEPLLIFNHPSYLSGLVLKIQKGTTASTLKAIEQTWKQFAPERPFNYRFLDLEYDRLYKTEQQFEKIVLIFSTIAISIACLGLIGLSSFTTMQREKELTIRKILGATSQSIIVLLSKGYLRLILGASLFAIPASYYLLNKWLDSFSYKIQLSPFYFIGSVLLMIVLAGLTIGFQSFKASIANPAERLRMD